MRSTDGWKKTIHFSKEIPQTGRWEFFILRTKLLSLLAELNQDKAKLKLDWGYH
jgi:hypothetical protein